MKPIWVHIANRPRLMRELVMATISAELDIEIVGERKLTHSRRARRRAVPAGAVLCLALVFCCNTRAQDRRQAPMPSSELGQENMSLVAASPADIKAVLTENAGLMVELKRWVAKDATDHGQIVSESDLSNDAIFDRLQTDVRFRGIATLLLQHYGYLVPKVNPDSELGKEQELLVQERMKWLAQDQEEELAERCYAITSDCAEVAVRFFGVRASKIEICPLGVDTDLFCPPSGDNDFEARSQLRNRLGFADSDVVCIYTGRFDEDKNPALLAQAVSRLTRAGAPFRGLFVGNGVQGRAISSYAGCKTHPFIPFSNLGAFYRAADIGVWPAQESMSMLDAAACGLPIVVNDTMSAPERVNGNGFAYRLNDLDDLVDTLLKLQDPATRLRMGSCGAQKIARNFSWESIAKKRLRDYETSLSGERLPSVPAVTREML
jgi:glycosyltransferase involved in cell wall biosynthesis